MREKRPESRRKWLVNVLFAAVILAVAGVLVLLRGAGRDAEAPPEGPADLRRSEHRAGPAPGRRPDL